MQKEELNDILFSNNNLNTTFNAPKPNSKPATPNLRNGKTKSAITTVTSMKSNPLAKSLIKAHHRTADLDQIIDDIPFPGDDLSLTSFTNSSNSNSTPNKRIDEQQSKIFAHNPSSDEKDSQKPPLNRSSTKSIPRQQSHSYLYTDRRQQQASVNVSIQKPLQLNFDQNAIAEEGHGSSLESLTPSRMSKILDWNKNHITPGDSRSIFPQVIAPSIDISHEHISVDTNNNMIDHIHEKKVYDEDVISYNDRIKKSSEDSKLKIMLKKLEDERSSVENELNFQKKIYHKQSQENSYLNQRITELEEHLELIKAQDKGDLKTLRQKLLEQSRVKIYELTSKMDQKDEKIADLQSMIQKLNKNEDILKQSISKEVEKLHIDIDRYRILAKSHNDKVKELECFITNLNEKIAKEAKNNKNLMNNLSENMNDMENNQSNLNEQIITKDSKIEFLEQTVTELSDLTNQASDKLEKREREIENLKKQCETFMLDQHKISGLNLDSDKHWEIKFYDLQEEYERVKKLHEKQALKFKETINQQKSQIQQIDLLEFSQHNVLPQNISIIIEQKENDIRSLRDNYENELLTYKGQIDELQHKVQLLEFEAKQNQQSSGRSALEFTRTSDFSAKGVNQGVNCNLYIEPLEDLLVSLNIMNWNSLTYEENISNIGDYCRRMHEEIEGLEKIINELKRAQITSTTEIKVLKREYDNFREKYSELQSVEKESDEKIQILKHENSDLKKKLAIAGNNSNSLEFSNRESEANSERLEQNYIQATQDYKLLEADYKELHDKIRNNDINYKTLEIDQKKSLSQLQRAKEEIELYKLQLESSKQIDKNSHFEEIKRALNERIKVLEDKISKLLDEINGKEVENYELKEENRNLLESKNKTMRRAENKESEVISMNKKIKEFEDLLETEEKHRENLTTQYEKSLSSQREKISALEEENLQYIRDIHSRKEEINDKEIQVKKLDSEKHGLSLNVDKLNQRLHTIQENYQKIKVEEYDNLVNEVNLKEEQISSLKVHIKSMEIAYEEVKKVNGDLNNQLRGLEREKRVFNDKVTQLESDKQIINSKLDNSSALLKEKQTEINALIDQLRKKEELESTSTGEISNKTREIEKHKTLQNQFEKNLDAIKEEKKALKQKFEQAELSFFKVKDEAKQKDEQIKSLEDKNEKNNNYLKEKDKKNIELFNINKTLQENIKSFEEANINLKQEIDKKSRAVLAKTNEIKHTKKIEEKNHNLMSENLELNIKIQKLESEISTLNLQVLNKPIFEEKSPSLSSSSQRQDNVEKDNSNGLLMDSLTKLLQEFALKEAQFEDLKAGFRERISKLSSQIQLLDNKCSSLEDENNIIKEQYRLKQNSNDILNEKVKTLENALKIINSIGMQSQNESDIEIIPDDEQGKFKGTNMFSNTNNSLGGKMNNKFSKYHAIPNSNQREIENMADIDELQPPSSTKDFNLANHFNTLSVGNFNDFQDKIGSIQPNFQTTVNNKNDSPPDNVFMNNILDLISPEMISIEDTVTLMMEVLRRASQSSKLANMLASKDEFSFLTETIKKEREHSEFHENCNPTSRRKKSHRESMAFANNSQNFNSYRGRDSIMRNSQNNFHMTGGGLNSTRNGTLNHFAMYQDY